MKALALLGAVAAMALVPPTGVTQPPPLRDKPAPPISLPIIANGSGTFVLAHQRGHGVYLNFFASWCEPCQEEAKTLEKVTAGFAGKDVRVIGIAELDEAASVMSFARTHGVRYPIALDKNGYVGAAYRMNELPLHVFIGSNGIIREYVEGGPIPESELRTGLTEISAP